MGAKIYRSSRKSFEIQYESDKFTFTVCFPVTTSLKRRIIDQHIQINRGNRLLSLLFDNLMTASIKKRKGEILMEFDDCLYSKTSEIKKSKLTSQKQQSFSSMAFHFNNLSHPYMLVQPFMRGNEGFPLQQNSELNSVKQEKGSIFQQSLVNLSVNGEIPMLRDHYQNEVQLLINTFPLQYILQINSSMTECQQNVLSENQISLSDKFCAKNCFKPLPNTRKVQVITSPQTRETRQTSEIILEQIIEKAGPGLMVTSEKVSEFISETELQFNRASFRKQNSNSQSIQVLSSIGGTQMKMVDSNQTIDMSSSTSLRSNISCWGLANFYPNSLQELNRLNVCAGDDLDIAQETHNQIQTNARLSSMSILIDENKEMQELPLEKIILQLKVSSERFLARFDFSEVRTNRNVSQCPETGREKIIIRKENSTYVKNSQFHNLNKLFMYNILSMFRMDALENLRISGDISSELAKIINRLKISSRREHQNKTRGFFDYFSHGHYKVLFLQITPQNKQSIIQSEVDLQLHRTCFNIDLASETLTANEIAYLNAIKHVNYSIFITNIRENTLINESISSKQNTRRLYTIKAIAGIKKLARGIPIKRF